MILTECAFEVQSRPILSYRSNPGPLSDATGRFVWYAWGDRYAWAVGSAPRPGCAPDFANFLDCDRSSIPKQGHE
jgi:hypothetical protein